jgi:hypothetical protein
VAGSVKNPAGHEMPPEAAVAEPMTSAAVWRISDRAAILTVALLALVVALYYILRYAAHWAETDTTMLARAIRNMIDTGRLAPQSGFLYYNGYAYQTIVTFLIRLTGESVVTLQQVVLPLALVLQVAVGWLLFREVAGSGRGAALGTILLLLQPEFLFVVLRGSHEKFGRLFMMLALYALFRSYRSQTSLRHFAIYVGLFYLAAYGLIASNFLIGFSFMAALAFALLAHVALERTRFWHANFAAVKAGRLLLVVSAVFILAFLFLFLFYPPAQHDLFVLDSTFERMRALLLGASQPTDIYERIISSWVSPWVYAIINAANWLVILVSFPLWVAMGAGWFRGRERLRTPALWLLWLLYGAFGFQMLATVASDASGMFNNLQHRIFPSFSLLAVMVMAANLGGWRPGKGRRAATALVIAIVVGALAVLSPVKATNEPNLVGWWVFYTESEMRGLRWVDAKVNDASIWVGFTERLREAFYLVEGSSRGKSALDSSPVDPRAQDFLVSDAIRAQAARLDAALPEIGSSLAVYDNGEVQIYHRRPATPYQR